MGETSVIGVVPGRIITEHRRLTLGGVPDLPQDVAMVAVVARHGTRSIGRGLVQGFGLRRGAIASSVGHDSHNLCVVGADPDAMARAVARLIDCRAASWWRTRPASWPSWRCRSPA